MFLFHAYFFLSSNLPGKPLAEARHMFTDLSGSKAYQTSELEGMYRKWLRDFTAARPEMQEYCKNILMTGEGSSSQFGQDLFMFFNLYKYWPALNLTGFYVDSGANNAVELSNSYFFDVCLGWKGLCVEPMAAYHKEIREKRSCLLVPKCISDHDHWVRMTNDAVLSKVLSDDSLLSDYSGNVQCTSLKAMLESSPDWDPHRGISLWSLDVEGYELTVLEKVDFSEIKVDAILIEDTCVRKYARKLSELGFLLYHQLQIDALFVRPGLPLPATRWYNKQYDYFWKLNDDYRRYGGEASSVCY